MAKTKTKNKGTNGIKAGRRTGRRSSRGQLSGAAIKQAQYAALLKDPCGAPLVTGSYPGEVGMVGRYMSDNTSSTNPCGFAAYYPAINAADFQSAVTPSTVFAHSWTVAAPFSPGHTILAAAAAKSRALSACIQALFPNVSITNVTGEICVGCVSADSFNNGNYTVDQLFQLLPQKAIVTRNQYECKFTPGVFDDKFTTYGQLTTVDQSDTNVIIVAYRGLPASALPSFRITSVLEYTARVNSGLVPTGATVSAGINTMSVASAVHKAQPGWWHNLVSEIAQDASMVTRYVGRQALSAAGSYALRGISSALPMLTL